MFQYLLNPRNVLIEKKNLIENFSKARSLRIAAAAAAAVVVGEPANQYNLTP